MPQGVGNHNDADDGHKNPDAPAAPKNASRQGQPDSQGRDQATKPELERGECRHREKPPLVTKGKHYLVIKGQEPGDRLIEDVKH